MKNCLRTGLLLVAIGFVFAVAAKADDIHLCAIGADCNTGSVIEIQSSTTSATVSGGNWNDNGTTLWSVLAPPVTCAKNCNYPNLSSAISQESGSMTGINAMSFKVSDIAEGAWLFSGESITLPSEPIGTIYMAFTEDANGNLTSATPWSSSLINAPEPCSLMLLGAGLAGLLGLKKAKA